PQRQFACSRGCTSRSQHCTRHCNSPCRYEAEHENAERPNSRDLPYQYAWSHLRRMRPLCPPALHHYWVSRFWWTKAQDHLKGLLTWRTTKLCPLTISEHCIEKSAHSLHNDDTKRSNSSNNK